MKAFVTLLLLAGLGLLGSAFFGIYTAPGLEKFPTAQSMGLQRKSAQAARAQEVYEGKSAGQEKSNGVFPAKTNGAASRRNNLLNQRQNQIEGR